ncbi:MULTISPECIES: hemin uptake protein HemP [Dyella]|uniref:Hemin uptake protein HemP n=2 Tax=Dyella TaxID=231454 RepID=A0A4R0YXS6_9GAMM|nr:MULTISPECIES: hemin uptake protein HemP [Dyella]TBR40239.1 hemin uptake protein HemP [Dyella terrae]TCI12179.1 hemin uptake protein HemP [Dyella soli]
MSASTLSLLPQPSDLLARPLGLLRLKKSVPPADSARRVSSQALLDGAREVVITHQGNEYHLRLTRNDKLILTK